jgi:hypothetical protein
VTERVGKVKSEKRIMSRRRGFSLLEVGAAGILLLAMLTVCLQFLRASAVQRRGIHERRLAIQEADNAMERICALPWAQLTPEGIGRLGLDEGVRRVLPDSKLEIDVSGPEEEPEGKRIRLVIRLPGVEGQPDRSVGLAAWKYRKANE